MHRLALNIAVLTLLTALLAPAAASAAVKVGDVVRVALKNGSVVQGKLVAETETNFLVSVGDQNVAIPLSDVAEMISVGAPARTAVAPPAAAPRPRSPAGSRRGPEDPAWA